MVSLPPDANGLVDLPTKTAPTFENGGPSPIAIAARDDVICTNAFATAVPLRTVDVGSPVSNLNLHSADHPLVNSSASATANASHNATAVDSSANSSIVSRKRPKLRTAKESSYVVDTCDEATTATPTTTTLNSSPSGAVMGSDAQAQPPIHKRLRSGSTVAELIGLLQPFSVFLQSPPSSYAKCYYQLAEFLEAAVNKDENRKTSFRFSERPHGDIDDTQWRLLEEAVNVTSDDLLSTCWNKFTVIDKILTLSPMESWKESNFKFFDLQRHVWWIENTQDWFLGPCDLHKDYINIGMGALILELFYRFVWGRYTFFRYKQQTSASTPPHSGENGENSPAVQAVPEPDIKLRYVSEDVIESGDLGMGHDAEEETDENDNSDDETDDNEEESTPAQTPVIAEASLMESEQVEIYEGETKSDDIPGRASLFFSHASITSTIDEIEADLFEEMERNTTIPFFSGSWNISKVLTAFSRLAIDRAVHKGDAIHTLPETKKAILHQYSKYCKWLQNLGICTSGEDNCVWTWAHGVLEFVDTMYTLIFKNLTSNGTRVNLQMFSRLFPRISMIQDPRADARLPEICTTIEQALKSTGKVSDELSSVVTLLNGLMEERKTLNAHLSEDISTLTGIHKLLRENQRKRLQQVNEEIEAAREEFHRLTANVDLKPSVKVPRYSLNLHGVHVSHHYTRTKQSHGREIGNSIIISSFTQKSMFMMRRCQYGERGAFSYCALWEGDFCKEFYDFCMPFTLSAPSPQQFFLEVNSFCCRMGVKPPTKPSPSPSSNSTPSVPADQLSTPNPKESSAGTLCPSKTPKAEASFICTELTTGKMYIACTAGHILNTALRTEAKTRPPFQIKPTPLDCLCDRVSEVECGDEALIVVLGSAAFWRAGTVLCPQSSSPSTTNPPGTRNPASYVGAIAQAVPPPDSCWAFTQMQQVNSPITTTNSTTPSASASATTTATATANSNITTNTSASANTAGTATAARAKSSNCVAKKCGLPNWVASNQLDESQTNGEVVFAVLRLAPGAQAFSDKAALEISNVSLGTTVTENGSDTTTTTKSTATSEKRSTTKKPEKKKHTSTQQHYNDKS